MNHVQDTAININQVFHSTVNDGYNKYAAIGAYTTTLQLRYRAQLHPLPT